MTFLRDKLPKVITFLYMPDEPRPPEYPHILALAENIHSNPGPGRALPTFVTARYVEALDQAIDIWCSGPKGFQLDRVASERARGRQFWFYNGGRPGGAAITIDAPATDPRATIWAAFKHDVSVYFYWHAVHWRHNSQKQGERNQNVWADTITFDNRRQPNRSPDDEGYIHGDGVLVYPGRGTASPGRGSGFARTGADDPTRQLPAWATGSPVSDAGAEAGARRGIDEALQAIVPRVFSDAGTAREFSRNRRPVRDRPVGVGARDCDRHEQAQP